MQALWEDLIKLNAYTINIHNTLHLSHHVQQRGIQTAWRLPCGPSPLCWAQCFRWTKMVGSENSECAPHKSAKIRPGTLGSQVRISSAFLTIPMTLCCPAVYQALMATPLTTTWMSQYLLQWNPIFIPLFEHCNYITSQQPVLWIVVSCDLFNTLIDSLVKNLPGKVRSERQNRLNKEKKHVFEFLFFFWGGACYSAFSIRVFFEKEFKGKK